LLGEEIAIEFVIRVREEHGLAPISAAHVTWWGRPGTTKRAMGATGALGGTILRGHDMGLGVE
jgi:hypothetical protein